MLTSQQLRKFYRIIFIIPIINMKLYLSDKAVKQLIGSSAGARVMVHKTNDTGNLHELDIPLTKTQLNNLQDKKIGMMVNISKNNLNKVKGSGFWRDFVEGFSYGFTQPLNGLELVGREAIHALKNKNKGGALPLALIPAAKMALASIKPVQDIVAQNVGTDEGRSRIERRRQYLQGNGQYNLIHNNSRDALIESFGNGCQCNFKNKMTTGNGFSGDGITMEKFATLAEPIVSGIMDGLRVVNNGKVPVSAVNTVVNAVKRAFEVAKEGQVDEAIRSLKHVLLGNGLDPDEKNPKETKEQLAERIRRERRQREIDAERERRSNERRNNSSTMQARRRNLFDDDGSDGGLEGGSNHKKKLQGKGVKIL